MALLAAGVLLAVPHAGADVLTFDLTTCQISGGCGSSTLFGGRALQGNADLRP
jgi:hypothetical protein